MSNVHHLQFFELRQQAFGSRGVVIVLFELRDELTLTAYMLLARRNMPFCLSQMPLEHLTIDWTTEMTRAKSRVLLPLLETIARISDLPA